jgi:hypothetical protein
MTVTASQTLPSSLEPHAYDTPRENGIGFLPIALPLSQPNSGRWMRANNSRHFEQGRGRLPHAIKQHSLPSGPPPRYKHFEQRPVSWLAGHVLHPPSQAKNWLSGLSGVASPLTVAGAAAGFVLTHSPRSRFTFLTKSTSAPFMFQFSPWLSMQQTMISRAIAFDRGRIWRRGLTILSVFVFV